MTKNNAQKRSGGFQLCAVVKKDGTETEVSAPVTLDVFARLAKLAIRKETSTDVLEAKILQDLVDKGLPLISCNAEAILMELSKI
jgi:hypothetical protein